MDQSKKLLPVSLSQGDFHGLGIAYLLSFLSLSSLSPLLLCWPLDYTPADFTNTALQSQFGCGRACLPCASSDCWLFITGGDGRTKSLAGHSDPGSWLLEKQYSYLIWKSEIHPCMENQHKAYTSLKCDLKAWNGTCVPWVNFPQIGQACYESDRKIIYLPFSPSVGFREVTTKS